MPKPYIISGIDIGNSQIKVAIAKVERDLMMHELDKEYPGYGFAHHKGYGTKEHQAALAKLGPSPIHRMSYEPVKRCAILTG